MKTDRRAFMAKMGLVGGAIAAAGVMGEEAVSGTARQPRLKALLVNGSPHAEGCTYTRLSHSWRRSCRQPVFRRKFFSLGQRRYRIASRAGIVASIPECASGRMIR